MIAGVITVYAAFLIAAIVCFQMKENTRKALSFQELLGRLDPVRTEGAAFFALRSESDRTQTALNSEHLWRIMGGNEGLRRMGANAKVLILLASLIESRLPNADQHFVQKLRRDGLLLRRAVYKIRLAMILTKTGERVAAPLNEAGTAYWSMVRRLLLMYNDYHAPRVPILRAACNVA